MINYQQPQAQRGHSLLDLDALKVKLDALCREHMSFTAVVREAYPVIQPILQSGVPQAAVLRALNESSGVKGTPGAFKSALQRIRQEIKAAQILALQRQEQGQLMGAVPFVQGLFPFQQVQQFGAQPTAGMQSQSFGVPQSSMNGWTGQGAFFPEKSSVGNFGKL